VACKEIGRAINSEILARVDELKKYNWNAKATRYTSILYGTSQFQE